MKVATKFALAFLACGILSVLVYSSVAASREAQAMEQTVAEDLASLGHTLSLAVLAVWERDGEPRAHELVKYTDSDERIEARWTWLDDEKDPSLAPRADSDIAFAVRRGETKTWVNVRKNGERVVYVYLPLLRSGQRPAALELSRPLGKRSRV